MTSLQFAKLSFVTFLSAAIAGCGGGPGDMPEVAAVTGKVTLGGKPLASVQVQFQPDEGRASTATTDSEGMYTLQYNIDTEGAKIGEHTVTVTKVGDDENYEDYEGGKEGDDSAGGLPKTASDGSIKKTVKAGTTNEINIEL